MPCSVSSKQVPLGSQFVATLLLLSSRRPTEYELRNIFVGSLSYYVLQGLFLFIFFKFYSIMSHIYFFFSLLTINALFIHIAAFWLVFLWDF